MKFRKKPVVIEAVQFTGSNASELREFAGDAVGVHSMWFTVYTLEGNMNGQEGDWLIKGVKGEFYPCKPDIFAATYEPADSGTSDCGGCVALQARIDATRAVLDGATFDDKERIYNAWKALTGEAPARGGAPNCTAPHCNCPEGRCAVAEGAVQPGGTV